MTEKKSKKSYTKIIIISLILCSVLIFGYFTVQSNQAKNEIESQITSIIEKALNRRIYVGEIQNYSLKSLTLKDLKIFKNDELIEENQIFEAEGVILDFELDFLSALQGEESLDVGDITLIKPRMTLIRESDGSLNFLDGFKLKLGSIYSTNGLVVKDGILDYIDYKTNKENGLSTSIQEVNGYIALTDIPQIGIDCVGKRVKDSSPISLKGHCTLEKVDYVLDFNFKNAEADHFKYYFVQEDQLSFNSGLFDANLCLSNTFFNGASGKENWEGKIVLKEADLSSKYLGNRQMVQVSGSANFDLEGIHIDNFKGSYENSPFIIKGDIELSEKIHYDLELTSNNLHLDDVTGDVKNYLSFFEEFPITGTSDLFLNISGLDNEFQVSGEISAQNVQIKEYPISNFYSEFNFNSENIIFNKITAVLEDGKIEGIGEIALNKENPEYDITIDFGAISMQSDFIKTFASNYAENGILSGKLRVNGVLAEGEATYLDTAISVKGSEFGHLNLKAKGAIHEGNLLELEVIAGGINLKTIGERLNYTEIDGEAVFNGTLKGLVDNLKIEGIFTGQDPAISGIAFYDLQGKINYENKRLLLSEVVLDNENMHLKGGGVIDFPKEGEKVNIDTNIQVIGTEIESFSGIYDLNIPLAGIVNGEIKFMGYGSELTAEAKLSFTDFQLKEYYAESGNAVIKLQDNIVNIENMKIKLGENDLFVKGKINLAEDPNLDLRVNFLNQNVQTLLSGFVKSNLLEKFKGQATGSVEIRGAFDSPDVFLASIIEDVRLEGLPFNSIDLQLQKIGKLVTINRLKLKQQQGELDAEGWVDLHPEKEEMQVKINASNVDLKQLSNFINLDNDFEGLVNFTAIAKGSLFSPDISFSAQLRKARLSEFSFDLLELEALYNQEILKVNQFILNADGNQIIGKGEIPYRFSRRDSEENLPSLMDLPLKFSLDMENTDLSLAKLFFKDDFKKISGLANINMQLSGTLKNPILNGSIVLENSEMEFNKSIPGINNLNARARLKENVLEITEMDFQIEQLDMYANGQIVLNNLKPQDMQIKFWSDTQQITYKDLFNGKVDFNLELNGPFNFPQITGVVNLSESELHWFENESTSFDLNQVIPELSQLKGDIDVTVKVEDDLVAETKDFNLNLRGNIDIVGALSSPGINGELNVEQGYVAFLDKKFRVLKGKIIFPDSLEKDLILNIKAKTRIDDIDILLYVGGSPSQLAITLDSVPVLNESEIISLLMFNRNYAGLTEGELGDLLKEEMVNLLAQGLSLTFLNQIENEVANSLGLDEFNIETIFKNEQDPNLEQTNRLTLAGLALKMGKYFSEKFYLTYSAPLYEAGESNIEFEYKVKDDLILNTQVGTSASKDNEFELKFELQYEF